METKQEVKAGDVFYTSWGYDQTNYDFVVVKSISPTGKTAMCQKARLADKQHDGCQCDILTPSTQGYGKEFRMKIEFNERYQETWLRGSYPYLSRYEESWDEEAKERWASSTRLDTFSKHKEGSKYSQTDAYSGH